MEFCEGGSLDSIYREVKKLGGRTGEKVLGKIAEGVLNGLTYLHSKKIIHRDIKPSNILLCRNGQVKLCDFGVSGEFGTKGDANTFIGTSYYMAPERITGQSYTITSDVWSTGVTLLEVAQHRFPFPADGTEMQPRAGLIDLLTYIVRQPIPKLKDEPESGIKWSESFKYFIECWYVSSFLHHSPRLVPLLLLWGIGIGEGYMLTSMEIQSRETTLKKSFTMENARTSLDGGDEE
jgi:mitogen-activated protein kinase kinase